MTAVCLGTGTYTEHDIPYEFLGLSHFFFQSIYILYTSFVRIITIQYGSTLPVRGLRAGQLLSTPGLAAKFKASQFEPKK